jgi:L-ascorbate metabolism protein UlaG (beta-lactamase superfamily)
MLRTSARLGAVGPLLILTACGPAALSHPMSDHFDGRVFHNRYAAGQASGSFLKWMMNRNQGPWRKFTDAPPGPPPPRQVADLRVTFVNHATALIQVDGINVLTDPIWSERCSPVSFAGPRRRRPPGIRFEDLPPIDLVLVSHNHYDHMDLPTLRRLEAAYHPRFFTSLGNGAFLRAQGLTQVTELDWDQHIDLGSGRNVTAVSVQHFSNRGLLDRNATLWTGFVLGTPRGPVFFAGDTGYGPHFSDIERAFGPMRLALLPIGAYRPEWFMGPIHMSPREALRAHEDLHAGTSVAIHFGTFSLADDGETEPVEVLREAQREVGPRSEKFWVLGFGEGRDVP